MKMILTTNISEWLLKAIIIRFGLIISKKLLIKKILKLKDTRDIWKKSKSNSLQRLNRLSSWMWTMYWRELLNIKLYKENSPLRYLLQVTKHASLNSSSKEMKFWKKWAMILSLCCQSYWVINWNCERYSYYKSILYIICESI